MIKSYVNEDNYIKGVINIPVADLRTCWKELNKEKATIVLCSSGMRSSMGAAILKRHGFKRIVNVAGGMDGYINAGYGNNRRSQPQGHGLSAARPRVVSRKATGCQPQNEGMSAAEPTDASRKTRGCFQHNQETEISLIEKERSPTWIF